MRPVNLIPDDQRRGDRSPMRTGAFSYVLIGGLALALLAVIALAFTSKQISDRKNEVTNLKVQEQQVTAKAQSLQSFRRLPGDAAEPVRHRDQPRAEPLRLAARAQ